MRKKQLIKLGTGKKGKAVGGAVLSLAMIGMFAGSAMASGNIGDTAYSYLSSNMRAYTTETRPKMDDTSAYIYHKGDTRVNVEVWSRGANYTAGGSVMVGVGEQRYIANYVNETGGENCCLKIAPVDYGTYPIYGVWSPDSV